MMLILRNLLKTLRVFGKTNILKLKILNIKEMGFMI
jgi:hypothetical protein